MYSAEPWGEAPRPVVAIAHGALRSSANVLDWAERLRPLADVVLIDLPGHGGSEAVIPASLERIAAQVHRGLKVGLAGREVIFVGESLGGLAGLAIAASADPSPIVALLAIDPPLATKKLRHVHVNFAQVAIKRPEMAATINSMLKEIFGVEGEEVEERLYYDLFDSISIPTMILNGDITLLPPRNVSEAFCVMDEVDRYIVGKLHGDRAPIHVKAGGGHLLLRDHPDWCFDRLCELARMAGRPLGAATPDGTG